MKKYVGVLLATTMLPSISYAEVVKNSAGQEIKLNANKTWEYVNKNKENNLIVAWTAYEIMLKNGEDKEIPVIVSPQEIEIWDTRHLTKDEMVSVLNSINHVAKIGLKNVYSFKPRKVYITQAGTVINIKLEYTAQNSYGADVPSTLTSVYHLDENNEKLKYISSDKKW